MTRITGFRLRSSSQQNAKARPEAYRDAAALDRLLEKVRAMGESFFTMSDEMYGDWLDSLPQNEFIELIALK